MSTKTTPSFEQSLENLEQLVQQLESGELPLAEALSAYEQGVKLAKQCQQMLDKAELRIKKLQPNATDSNA